MKITDDVFQKIAGTDTLVHVEHLPTGTKGVMIAFDFTGATPTLRMYCRHNFDTFDAPIEEFKQLDLDNEN